MFAVVLQLHLTFVVGRLYDLIAPWAYAAGENQELL
jgi:hypothetical protein